MAFDPLRIGIYVASAAGAVALVLLGRKIMSGLFGGVSLPQLNCSEEFKAFNHGASRDMSAVKLIVVHSTEGATAKGAESWFANPIPISAGGPGSTQVVVGPDGCYRTLPDNVVPYGAGSPANNLGLHIELAGFAKWTRDEWLAQDSTLRLAAAQIAAWSASYGIPLEYIDASGLLAGKTGVTTHLQATNAWHATTHVDPGPNFPMDVLLKYAGGQAPADGVPNA